MVLEITLNINGLFKRVLGHSTALLVTSLCMHALPVEDETPLKSCTDEASSTLLFLDR